ncbi:MAG: hypothetical protein DBX55_04190 [Verrucomicrobia bacterium]|nr:MAG: hypothetical protein DBX55_04190 [Verrucomicrobiota bacterium]
MKRSSTTPEFEKNESRRGATSHNAEKLPEGKTPHKLPPPHLPYKAHALSKIQNSAHSRGRVRFASRRTRKSGRLARGKPRGNARFSTPHAAQSAAARPA